MRISDWSSDVCSSDLAAREREVDHGRYQLVTKLSPPHGAAPQRQAQPRAFPDGGTGRYPARAQMRDYLAKHMRASGRHRPDRGLVLATRVRADAVYRHRPISLLQLTTTHNPPPPPPEPA